MTRIDHHTSAASFGDAFAFSPYTGRSSNWLRGWPLIILPLGAAFVSLYVLNTGSILPLMAILAVGSLVLIYKALREAQVKRESIIAPLIAITIVVDCAFLEGAVRAALHYGLVSLFCVLCIPETLRSGILRSGGFSAYKIYFIWALCTLTYSLSPLYSAARLTDAVLMYAAMCAIVLHLQEGKDVTYLIERFLVICAIFVLFNGVAAVLLPHRLTWEAPDLFTNNQSVERFRGLLGNPNGVGAMMFITVGPTLAFWNKFDARKRMLFAGASLLAIGENVLADSRSPFIALAVGCAVYAVWQYGVRGVLTLAGAGALIAVVLMLFGRNVGDYAARGDLTTLTGRTEMWRFVVNQIAQHPLTGYGYEVSGEIFQSRYFPIWFGPWDQGAQSSLHNGYLNRAIGLGVPAALFWLYLTMRPWVFLITQKRDPWNLKPALFLIVLPALIYNSSESALSDFLGSVGLLFGLVWAIAEAYRLQSCNRAELGTKERPIILTAAISG